MWIVLLRVLTVEGYKFTSHLASLPAKANDKAIDDHQEMERIAPTLNPAFAELFIARGFGFAVANGVYLEDVDGANGADTDDWPAMMLQLKIERPR